MAKLVAIGDSLTQGFQSLAIHSSQYSYPALIAECMGLSTTEFQTPSFAGKGGLPMNVEWVTRRLEERFGANIGVFEWAFAVDAMIDLVDEVEEYWEEGIGSQPSADTLYHNLAVWGFEVGDAYAITSAMCDALIGAPRNDWLRWPSQPRLRTARKVLNPGQIEARKDDTQITIARRIRERDGEILNLIVWLGANNCLGTVVDLKIRETGDTPPGPNSPFNLWKPTAFRLEYEELARQIQTIGATNVYVATIPRLTIPPITRGIMKNRGQLPDTRIYFDFYTRFFIKDKEFDPQRDPKLTRAEAEKIDSYIDQYNLVIREVADANGWFVVDMWKVLNQLAVRRNHGMPTYPLPAAIADLSIRFYEVAPSGAVLNGGLTSLDGVHPTTCGYAIAAQEFINVMRKRNPRIQDIDFARVRRLDTLVSRPPRTLDDIFGFLETLERWFHVSRLYDRDA